MVKERMIRQESSLQPPNLPIRIMRMVKELHRRGFGSLYLFAGMSSSGMSWRYFIGLMVDKKWPAEPFMVKDSIGPEGEVPWTRDNSSVETLTVGFESFYGELLKGSKTGSTDYSEWYDRLIDSLRPAEILRFFADGPADHDHLLQDAPGFDRHTASRHTP